MVAIACGSEEPAAGGATGHPTSGDACVTPEVALPDGSCIRPGIPSDGCSGGFEHDGEYGCAPILPDDDCAPGMMAVPGDIACRPVMPCGQGKWGDLPVDADTQYVDGSYQGGDSDGSSSKPWVTISDAYQDAAANDLIAIAEGRYPEQLLLAGKPIRLWGVCPEKVSLEWNGPGHTIRLSDATNGTAIGGVAITGAEIGVEVVSAQDITLDRVWIHDTGLPGLAVANLRGRPSVHLTHSLIESSRVAGIYVLGSDLSISSSVVRHTRERLADQVHGVGLDARPVCNSTDCDETTRPRLTIEGSRFEGNLSHGLFVMGGDLSMKGSLVRNTAPQRSDHTLGEGLRLLPACDKLDRCYAAQPTRATVESSFIDNNHSSGIDVAASQLTLTTSVVRRTQPEAADKSKGLGVFIHSACSTSACDERAGAQATIQDTLIEHNHGAAIFAESSKVTTERTVVRHTLPQERDQQHGYGILAQTACDEAVGCDKRFSSELTVADCFISDSHVAGIKVVGSHATLSSTVVQHTSPATTGAPFGDGVLFVSYQRPATGSIDALSIRDSSRAGIANFGADISIRGTHIACAAFELAGEALEQTPFRFDNGGNNVCGCPQPNVACKAMSAGLKPPAFLP